MAKPGGTKRVVWCSWSANVVGRLFSGRDQFSAESYKDYLSADPVRREKGLGHVASVIKGALKKRGDLPRCSNPRLGREQIKLWDPVAGPKEIPRGRKRPKTKELPKKTAKQRTPPDQKRLF